MAITADSFDHRARIYDGLRRRNRFVGLLRWLVPALGLLVAGGLIVEIIIANLGNDYGIAGLTIEDGKVVISDPRYGGQTGDGMSYDVVADAALVSMEDPDQIDMRNATITTLDENDYKMDASAAFAHLDLGREHVTVDGRMTTIDSDGVIGELYRTEIFWRGQRMVSEGPVRFDFEDGSAIASDTLTYNSNRDIWRFGPTVYTTPGDEEQPATKITSDTMTYDADAGTADFAGNAVVEQEDTVINSDSVVAHFGGGGTSNIEKIEALGGVKMVDPEQTTTGETGVYDPNTKVMNLTGDVKVLRETGIITSGQLSVDLSTNVTEFSTDGSNRVNGDFNPPDADRAQIVADRMVDLADQNRTEFSGSTVVEMSEQTVWADRFIVHYEADNSDAIANYEMLGSVRIRNPQQTATGNRGVYDPDTRLLRLTGNVRVTDDNGTVNAPELLVNLATNVSQFSASGEGNRVSGVFSPDNPPQTQ